MLITNRGFLRHLAQSGPVGLSGDSGLSMACYTLGTGQARIKIRPLSK